MNKPIPTADIVARLRDVQIERIYTSGGDTYAAVIVPVAADPVQHCLAVQALTGYTLRCVPA